MMSVAKMIIMALMSFAAIAGCNDNFQSAYLVIDRRILAVRVDPPEVQVNVSFNEGVPDLSSIDLNALPKPVLSLLVVEPGGSVGELFWEAFACPTNSDHTCEGQAVKLSLGSGFAKPEELRIKLEPSLQLLGACLQSDPLAAMAGAAVQVTIQIGQGKEALHAIKDVIYGTPWPAGRTANTNPVLDSLKFKEQVWTEALIPSLSAGEEVKIEPFPNQSSQEAYELANYDGTTEKYQEHFLYQFYITGGSFSPAKTGGRDKFEEGNLDPLHTMFKPPASAPAGDKLFFWLVINDQRGGVSWLKRTLLY